MKYMLLIYYSPDAPETTPEKMTEWFAFDAATRTEGVYVAGDALMPSQTATTLRGASPADVVITDGPFAETKEILGGYYVLDCRDLDHALEYARRLNAIESNTIEVRPVVVF